MPDLTPAATAIRQAVEAVFAISPAPPTTEDVAAAVLRAGAAQLMDSGGDRKCVDCLMRLAAELEGIDA